MPAKFEGNLVPVRVQLHEADRDLLEAKYGRGWTGRIRDIVHDHCNKSLRPKKPMKLEDLHGNFS